MCTKPGTELQGSQRLCLWLLLLCNQPPLEKTRQRKEGMSSSRLTEHKEEMRTPSSSASILHQAGMVLGFEERDPPGLQPPLCVYHFLSVA